MAAMIFTAAAAALLWNRTDTSTVESTQEQAAVIAALEAVPNSAGTARSASETIAPPSPDAQDDFPAIIDSAVRDVQAREFPTSVGFEIVEAIPHDTEAYTQGLELSDGRLFESTGLVGASSIREIDPATGEVLRITDVDDVFAEGLTVFESADGTPDTALQLTWQNGTAYRYDAETFAVLETYAYDTQGWGLCHDLATDQLVMSDGTSTLQIRDVDDFSVIRTVDVTFSGVPIAELNELECVGGRVWSNIWKSSLIIEIDPTNGMVTSVLNAQSLTPEGYAGRTGDVLNGIAYDAQDGTYLITGKRWPVIYRVRFITDG